MKNSASTFLIFISSTIRSYDYPRITGFSHTTEFKDVIGPDGKALGERYVYLGRELTIDEFNKAAALIFNHNFQGEERTFQPLALDPEAEAKREEAQAKDVKRIEAENKAAAKAEAVEEARIEAEKAVEANAARKAAEQEVADRELARQSRDAVAKATRDRDIANADEQKRLAAEESAKLKQSAPKPPAAKPETK